MVRKTIRPIGGDDSGTDHMEFWIRLGLDEFDEYMVLPKHVACRAPEKQ